MFYSDRALGKKVDPKGIASLMDNLATKGFGRVVRKDPHAFFIINKEFLASNYAQLGLDYKDVVAAMAKTSTIPKKFEYLLGKLLSVISQSQNRIYPYAHISSYYKIKQLWLFGHISIYRNMTFIFPFLLCHLK